MSKLSDLQVADFELMLVVWRHASISKAARELGTTPSHVSKAVSRLERQLQTRLIERSTKGVVASEAGQRLQGDIQSWLSRLGEIRQKAPKAKTYMTFAATSFLGIALFPRLVEAAPDLHWRGINLTRAAMRAYLGEGVYDLALSLDEHRLPTGWTTTTLGRLHHGLFASPKTARNLGPAPLTRERAAALAFLSPVGLTDGKWMAGEDHCPLARAERELGHEVETVGVGLEIAARTDQVIFAPAITAQPWLHSQRLVELPVTDWDVSMPLHLIVNAEKVRAREFKAWLWVLKETLAELDSV